MPEANRWIEAPKTKCPLELGFLVLSLFFSLIVKLAYILLYFFIIDYNKKVFNIGSKTIFYLRILCEIVIYLQTFRTHILSIRQVHNFFEDVEPILEFGTLFFLFNVNNVYKNIVNFNIIFCKNCPYVFLYLRKTYVFLIRQ